MTEDKIRLTSNISKDEEILDKDYKIPRTRNNYKGEDIGHIVLPGKEVAKTKLVNGAFGLNAMKTVGVLSRKPTGIPML